MHASSLEPPVDERRIAGASPAPPRPPEAPPQTVARHSARERIDLECRGRRGGRNAPQPDRVARGPRPLHRERVGHGTLVAGQRTSNGGTPGGRAPETQLIAA